MQRRRWNASRKADLPSIPSAPDVIQAIPDDDLLDVAGDATAGSRAVGGDCQISLKKLHQLFGFPDLRLDKFLRKQLARPSRVEQKGVKKRCLRP